MLYRPQTGGLAEAMEQVQEFDSEEALLSYLTSRYKRYQEELVFRTEHQGFDERINWDTWHIILEGWGPCGYTNEPVFT